MSKLFNLNPRKPNTLSEDAARKLEEAIAAKGEGVAGQTSAVVVPAIVETRELTSSPAPSVQAMQPEPEPIIEPASVTTVEEVTAQARNVVSPRTRGTTKPRPRELPTTGVGTMHNPRVRKTDGVKTRSTTVHLPVELAKKLAVHCAMSGRKQSEVIGEAVGRLLADS